MSLVAHSDGGSGRTSTTALLEQGSIEVKLTLPQGTSPSEGASLFEGLADFRESRPSSRPT